ncbi:MAG: NADH-quinone oxidoreductase subunit C [Anaerolinea sp.]|nr:NADH-quinone oxidoreductase subunit C [Anaerolinea sp.]
MNDTLKPVIEAIQARWRMTVQDFRDETTLVVAPQYLLDLCRALRDEFSFDMLENETAVDYWPQQKPRFHVVYHFYSFSRNAILCLRVPLNGNAPVISTLETVYPNANWHEREIWDMFGIWFEGHSDMRRILMPQDWKGHPQRKDYPLGYEEVQFTFNFDQISLKKPAPKE